MPVESHDLHKQGDALSGVKPAFRAQRLRTWRPVLCSAEHNLQLCLSICSNHPYRLASVRIPDDKLTLLSREPGSKVNRLSRMLNSNMHILHSETTLVTHQSAAYNQFERWHPLKAGYSLVVASGVLMSAQTPEGRGSQGWKEIMIADEEICSSKQTEPKKSTSRKLPEYFTWSTRRGTIRSLWLGSVRKGTSKIMLHDIQVQSDTIPEPTRQQTTIATTQETKPSKIPTFCYRFRSTRCLRDHQSYELDSPVTFLLSGNGI